MRCLFIFMFVISHMCILPISAEKVSFDKVKALLESRCTDCHDSDTTKGNFNVDPVISGKLSFDKSEKSWIKIERAIMSGDMPPKKKKPLTAADKSVVATYFEDKFILRKGKEHIGQSILRRLTRYEIENTLEDLLHIKLKYPYVWSTEYPSMVKSHIELTVPEDVQGESGFRNDAHQLVQSKISMVKLINYMDYAVRSFANNSAAQKKFFGAEINKKVSESKAKNLLTVFMKKAYRGYRNSENEAAVFKAFAKHRQKHNEIDSLYHACKIALLSPSFLYHMETSKNSNIAYKISGVELANRLSYFLWSSMPDDELMSLGLSGEILNNTILKQQIDRMLNSPKRLSLSENFAGQWLGFESLKTDKRFFVKEAWNRGIYDELLFFFDELIKSDRSVLDIVNSDWTYKSPYTKNKIQNDRRKKKAAKYSDFLSARSKKPGRLEKFYTPPRFTPIKDGKMGGMITTNGIMRLTSAPDRTSPIRRGVWVTEVIIGRHMVPPENVPPLSKSEKAGGKKLTRLVDILAEHTAKAACISCHQHIDPLGMGLENFGPFGEYRTKYKDKQQIISQGKLPNGKTFSNPQQLKVLLLDFYKDAIVKNSIKRMMSYAIGRKLRPYDIPTIEAIKKKMASNNYSINTLISEIIMSKQFQYRQDLP